MRCQIKEFRAEVIFGGKVEPSVQESFEKFHKQLEAIQEQAKEATETLKEMGETVMDFGIALLGIEEAKNVFDWLNESGKRFLETQNKINWALEEQMNLLHKGPEGLKKAKEELERLNEQWRKGSSFSKEAIEGIEAALLSAKGNYGERLTPDAIKRLVPSILANAIRHGQYTMTEQQAEAAGNQIAEFILKGGRGSLEALGVTVDRQEVTKWMKEHYGEMGKKGKPGKVEVTPAMAAEYLKTILGGSGQDIKALRESVGAPEAQPAEVARSFEEMATRIGTSMEKAFQPVARMMNIILGDDPSGKGSPLDRFLDNIDTRTKEFDNWVRTNFETTWKGVEKIFEDVGAALKPVYDLMHAADLAEYKAIFDSMSTSWRAFQEALAGVKEWTTQKVPFLDLATNFKSIGDTMNKIWGDFRDILAELNIHLGDFSQVVKAIYSVELVGLEAALKTLDIALKAFEGTLRIVKDLMDVVFHPPAINATEQGYQAFLVSHPGATMDQYKAALAEHEAKAAAVRGHAEGGIFTTPHIGMVAESGPEAIIPLGDAGLGTKLFDELGLGPHIAESQKKLKESEESTTKMGEIFATLPDLGSQFLTQIAQAMQEMVSMEQSFGQMGMAGGVPGAPFTGPVSGAHFTEFGPAVAGDQPGQATYDYNSYHHIGAWPGITGPLRAGDVALGYGAQAKYHVQPGQMFTDEYGRSWRFADRSGSRDPYNVDVFKGVTGGIANQRMLSWIGEEGPEAVIPLKRTPRAMALLEKASDTMGVSTTGPFTFHFSINVNGGGPEAGEGVKTAMLRVQEQLEAMLEDILRRHRREQFA